MIMGLFARLAALIRGSFRKTVNELEVKNPDALLEDLRERIEKTGREARQQIIDIQTNAELIRMEMEDSQRKLDQIRNRIEDVRNKGDVELLAHLLIQEEDLEAEVEQNSRMYENAMLEIGRIRQDYTLFEAEMNARFSELRSLKSQARIAALKENIIALNDRYAAKNKSMVKLNESMDRARQAVNIKIAQAKAAESVSNENVDLQLRRLDMQTRREKALLKARQMIEQNGDDTIQTNLN